MKEKRNIQISLEEAREWYNSGDSFKKELALKAYEEEELKELNYLVIRDMKSEFIKIDMRRNIMWYIIYNRLAKKYPFASIQEIIDETNKLIKDEMDA